MKQTLHRWWLILTLGLFAGMSSCSKDEAVSVSVSVPKNTVEFAAFDKEAQTITVDTNCEWTFEVQGDTQICEVTREEGSNTLTITPNINYDNISYTAKIVITASDGSNKATQTITVTQAANSDTYITFFESAFNNDNPIIQVDNNPDGDNSVREIKLSTNNKLTVTLSETQSDDTSETSLFNADPTRVDIEGCDWISYEVSEETDNSGTYTVLTLTCDNNPSTTKSRTAYLDITSGAGTNNKVVTKKVCISQLASTPTIIINAPEGGLVAAYDQSEPLSFSVVTNIDITYNWLNWEGGSRWATLTETTEEGESSSLSKIHTYEIEFDSWSETTPRTVTLSFAAAEGGGTVASADLKITQEAAPKASITLVKNSVVINNGEESDKQYLDVTCSFTTMEISAKDSQSGEDVEWVTTTYKPSADVLEISVDGTSETTREAIVTLTCGSGDNIASASFTVTQLGTQPSLQLDPENVQLDSKGTAQVVSVLTNQTDWEVVDASPDSNFTLVVDKEKKTITVSGTDLASGERTHTYTVKAGELEVTLTVSQRTAYQVGDPYIVNGKTVGIVYEVDEQGMHGKAFALTTYNGWDKFFCYTGQSGFKMDESNAPLSSTDGLTNQELIKSIANWDESFLMTKWTVDLGQAQGVNWYVPAIEELKAMIEYMSNAKFQKNPDTGIEALPQFEEVNPEWDIIRNLYKQYTTKENGYETEQYVVFYWGDARKETVTDPDDWTIVLEVGDEVATYWASSTVVNINTSGSPLYRMKLAMFDYGGESCSIRNDVDACTPYNDDPYYGGSSIHPICQF